MALNLENPEVEALATELSIETGESKTETIRKALEERRRRLSFERSPRRRGESFLRFLEEEIWPLIPADHRRRPTPEEEDKILGFGPEGVAFRRR